MFTITHINRINTDLTCNCLLAPPSTWCPHKKTKLPSFYATDVHCSSLQNTDDKANNHNHYDNNNNLYFYAACYELGKANTSDVQKNCKDTEIQKYQDQQQQQNCEQCDVRISDQCQKQSSSSPPMYRGSVIRYTYSLRSNVNDNSYYDVDILNRFTINEMKDMTYTQTHLPNHSVFPGVFDLNYIPRSWTPFAHITHSHYSPGFHATKTCKEQSVLVASCTDGSVRMLNTLPHSHQRTQHTTYNSNILSNSHIYSNVAQTMITSTTPFLFYGSSVPSDNQYKSTLHLLTTHHGGGVQVTNTHKQLFHSGNDAKQSLLSKQHKKQKITPTCTYKQNTHQQQLSSSVQQFHLHPHEYDAWCSCVLPLQSSSLSTHLQCMCTGGDDGLLYFHDLRLCDAQDDCICHNQTDDHQCINSTNDNDNKQYASSVVAKVQFDAGVVSLAPVIEQCSSPTTSSSSLSQTNSTNTTIQTNWNTPYLLAGCYDESISLLDVRQLAQSKYQTTVRNNCKKVNTIVRKTNLGGGVWRCNRTLYPTYNNYNKTLTQSQQIQMQGQYSYCSYNNTYMNAVNTNNILVLPLMQRGAALLPYNVKLSANDIFASELIYFPFQQIQHNLLSQSTHTTSSTNTQLLLSTPKSTDQQCLVYDVAVLNANHDCTQFIVASCSFYERAIDIWQVQC